MLTFYEVQAGLQDECDRLGIVATVSYGDLRDLFASIMRILIWILKKY